MHEPREQGFTLVELAVAMVVLGIVMTIAVSGTNRMIRSSRMVGAVNTLVADLHYARAMATTERKNFDVVFEPSAYSVIRKSPPATVLRRILPTGVSCTATDTSTFYAWGLTDAITITLSGSGSSKVLQLTANGNVSHP